MATTTLQRQLDEFRATFPVAELRHGAQTWRYHRGGTGTATVLWLTGVLGAGEFAFARALQLGRRFAVIAPDYPPADTLDEMADGLVAILTAERVARAHVIGGSFGGMIAQHLVRRHPSRVRSLVLSHTAAPRTSPMGGVALRVLPLLPERALRALFRRRLRPGFTDAESFWAPYFDHCIARLRKRDLLSRVALDREFARARYAPGDLATWDGHLLILDSDDDPLMAPASRAALRDLYPQAQVHTFSGTGHASAILRPEEWVRLVESFLTST